MKHVLRRPSVISLLSYVILAYMRLVYRTACKETHVAPEAAPYLSDEQQSITCVWHARLLMMPLMKTRTRSLDVLISQHRDGMLISETVARLGIGTITGSSSKGGLSGVRGLLRRIRGGGNVGITPDGPRGPARVAARGVAQVGITSGLPVIPMAYATSRYLRMRSWDRFFVPLPFTRLVYTVGAPILPDSFADDEAFRLAIEAGLNDATNEADRLAGVPLEDSPPSR